MATLNQDLIFRDLYLKVIARKDFDFFAKRADLGFNNVENEFTIINFNFPFRLPELQYEGVITQLLLEESVGKIKINPNDKFRFLVKLHFGVIWYFKIEEGDLWRVMVDFDNPNTGDNL